MSNELSTTRYEPVDLKAALVLAATIYASRMYTQYKSTEAIAVAIMVGAELGLAAMQSLRSIHIIDGRPSFSADLVVGLVKRSPVCRWFRMVASTPERAEYATLREGDPEPTPYVYTWEDAQRAGLTNRPNWRKHPAAMLRARCASALARAVYPDIVMGLLEPLPMDVGEDGGDAPATSITRTSHAQLLDERQPKSLAAIESEHRDGGAHAMRDPVIEVAHGPAFPTAPLRAVESGEVVAERAPVEPLPTVPRIRIAELDPIRIKGDLPRGLSTLLGGADGPEHDALEFEFDSTASRSAYLRKRWLGYAKKGEKSAQVFNLASRLNNGAWRDVLHHDEALRIREWIVTEFARPKDEREFTLEERTDPDRHSQYCEMVEADTVDGAIRTLAIEVARCEARLTRDGVDHMLRGREANNPLTIAERAAHIATMARIAAFHASAGRDPGIDMMSEYEIACIVADQMRARAAKLKASADEAIRLRKSEITETYKALGFNSQEVTEIMGGIGGESGSLDRAARTIARLHIVARDRTAEQRGEVA